MKLHRSITFWSGLLIIAFTCWAWRDSYRYSSFFTTGYWSWANNRGGVQLFHFGSSTAQWNGARSYNATRHLQPHLFQRAFFVRGKGEMPDPRDFDPGYDSPSTYEWARYHYRYYPPRMWDLFIPHWLVLTPIVITWLALLAWRARRRKRKMPNAGFPNDE